ncbi:DMT family transporter [Vibrio sp.]|uniref:DMT family transporter n=1 Tax=Vibrio viridaestus TaxID=2487322 RepID=A0A3N9TJD8_9VIBR|nr:DMT family transporter [Vibrio viridaestus]MDC0610696.1 DMT family transporter [Vibrio sp.]RQW63675.1 DMT family transporter [Vibrio viridaestus]
MNMGYINVIMCYLLVGISYPIAADSMNAIPVWTFIAITFAIGFVFLYIIGRATGAPAIFSLSIKTWAIISLQSLLGAVLYTAFLLFGFEYSSAISASIFTSIAPAVVLTLSYFILKEKLSFKKGIAIGLAIAGVLVLTIPTTESSGSSSIYGILLLALSTLSTSGCVIAAKKYDVQLPALTMATGVCFTGLIFTAPLMFILESNSFDITTLFDTKNTLTMIYYGILVWAVPYFCFFNGVTKIPASATGMAFAVIPVASTFFSILFFNQSLSMTDGIALLMVTASILLSESKEVSSDIAELELEN